VPERPAPRNPPPTQDLLNPGKPQHPLADEVHQHSLRFRDRGKEIGALRERVLVFPNRAQPYPTTGHQSPLQNTTTDAAIACASVSACVDRRRRLRRFRWRTLWPIANVGESSVFCKEYSRLASLVE